MRFLSLGLIFTFCRQQFQMATKSYQLLPLEQYFWTKKYKVSSKSNKEKYSEHIFQFLNFKTIVLTKSEQ